MLGKHLNHCEDSLTAAVFSHLLHLPIEVFWTILRNACYTSILPESAGEPRSVEGWPKWNPQGTGNNTYVEPDVFIRFPEFDLIVEAKRWDERMQDAGQWKKELIAYANEHGQDRRPVKMIALGGIHHQSAQEVKHEWSTSESGQWNGVSHLFICPVIMCRWRGIMDQCKRMASEVGRMKFGSSQSRATQRILSDLIGLFAAHGFQTGIWFADLIPKLPPLVAYKHSPQVFRSLSIRFSK